MSFEEPNDPRSSEIVNKQIQLTELATYEERTPGDNSLSSLVGTGSNRHVVGLDAVISLFSSSHPIVVKHSSFLWVRCMKLKY